VTLGDNRETVTLYSDIEYSDMHSRLFIKFVTLLLILSC
jgi:hypothetical protein